MSRKDPRFDPEFQKNIQQKRESTNKIQGKEIGNTSILNEHLANGLITSEKLSDGSVTNSKLATDSVTADKIATGAVSTSEINTNAEPTVNTIYSNSWFRSNGATGWYNQTYGGGIFMEDSTYVKVYNGKAFMPSAGNGDNGIVFPLNPGGGGGDAASIKYYAYSGEASQLVIQVENDGDDYILIQRKRFDSVNTFMEFGNNIRTSASSHYINSSDGTVDLNSNTGGGIYSWRGTNNGGFGIHHFSSNVGGLFSLKAYVNANGDFIKNSDVKIKENIKPARNYLSDILKLNVVTYTYKNSGTNDKNLGLIAQEVEQVFPSIVKNVDYFKKINTESTEQVQDSIKMLAYDAFVPMLIKCTQEQQEMIEKQQKQLENLEERIKLLEDLLK